MIRYFVNFWIWWYIVKAGDFLRSLLGIWGFILNYLNIPAMAENFFVPLYQDHTALGGFISVFIRSVWLFFGVIAMALVSIPMVALYLIYLLLPVLPIFLLLFNFLERII